MNYKPEIGGNKTLVQKLLSGKESGFGWFPEKMEHGPYYLRGKVGPGLHFLFS